MKTNDLLTIWSAPEPPRLTPKQISIRLPIVVTAKISALLDLFPKKTKTDILNDLLISALEKLESELPMKIDSEADCINPPHSATEAEYHCYYGMRSKYFSLVEKYLRETEKEAGITEPMEFSYPDAYHESEFKWEDK